MRRRKNDGRHERNCATNPPVLGCREFRPTRPRHFLGFGISEADPKPTLRRNRQCTNDVSGTIGTAVTAVALFLGGCSEATSKPDTTGPIGDVVWSEAYGASAGGFIYEIKFSFLTSTTPPKERHRVVGSVLATVEIP